MSHPPKLAIIVPFQPRKPKPAHRAKPRSRKLALSDAGKMGSAIKKIRQAKCSNFRLVKLTYSQSAGILSLFRSL
jgi:hypothetical protein